MGSRNAKDWIEALQMNQSLTEKLCVVGMNHKKNDVKSETYNEETMDYRVPSDCVSGNIYFKDGTFPDATLTREQDLKIRPLIKTKVTWFINI